MAEVLTIGRLARAAGVNIQTIRYYERRNLLRTTVRTPAGYRLYGHEEFQRLTFIQHAQASGFTLREIADLLNLRVKADTPCAEVQQKAHEKLVALEARIKHLHAVTQTIRRLLRLCETEHAMSRCPILECWAEEHGERRQVTGTRSRKTQKPIGLGTAHVKEGV